jgi:adenylate cyclase
MAEDRLERRLAAILAADVASYSRLMGVDEEGTLAALKGLRKSLIDPKIAEHRGRMVKPTGDGALVEFASAVDAVRCALQIQRAMAEHNATVPEDRRIEFRIGINVGDIIIDEGDIYGDGVNIAARVETLAAPGSICLSDNALQQIKRKLALDVNDMGEQQLKNIAQPVRVHSVRIDGVGTTSTGAQPTGGAPRLSMIVLPFANLSGDPAQDYFADGITEDITTDLSRIPDSFVIARNTAFTFKGKTVDAKQIGHELGVRYVLEGSVRRAGTRVRANAQLIDARNGAHLWAERFDCDRSDLMDVQDEIVGRIASALGAQLIDAESKRAMRERPTNPDAVDLTMQGWASLNRSPTHESLADARRLFERAIALDATAASALVGLACGLVRAVNSGFSSSLDADLARAHTLVGKALAIAPENERAHWVLGSILRSERKLEQAVAAFEAAITLDRNLAPAFGSLGDVVTFLGRPDETIRYNHQAIRLSPRDPMLASWQFDIGMAHGLLGSLDDAVEALLRARNNNPELPFVGFGLAAAYAMAGNLDLARIELAAAQKTAPWATNAAKIKEAVPPCDNPKSRDMIEKFLWTGLRLAGLLDH